MGDMGPVIIGVLVIGLMVAIWLLTRLLRMILTPSGTVKRKGVVTIVEEPAFDADAALERYLARKAAGEGSAEIPPAEDAPRPVFGRKIE